MREWPLLARPARAMAPAIICIVMAVATRSEAEIWAMVQSKEAQVSKSQAWNIRRAAPCVLGLDRF
jgi:hypothetical protein